MAAKATFALKVGVWFRRGRPLIMVPVRKKACLIRNTHATYPTVQISGATSLRLPTAQWEGSVQVCQPSAVASRLWVDLGY